MDVLGDLPALGKQPCADGWVSCDDPLPCLGRNEVVTGGFTCDRKRTAMGTARL